MTEERIRYYSTLADDDDLKEIISLFVEEMADRAARFQNALDSGNREELRIAVHQFKGAAGSHGFGELSLIAKDLENKLKADASEEDISEATRLLIVACHQATSLPKPL